MRKAAVKRLDNQAILAEIVKNKNNDRDVALEALRTLADQELVADIVKNGPRDIRRAAAQRLHDQELLLDLIRNFRDIGVFYDAIRNLDDPTFLAEFSTYDATKEKISDQELFEDIARNYVHGKYDGSMVRARATLRIKDEELLKEFAKDKEHLRSIDALENIHDQMFLEDIAKNATELDKRRAAEKRLNKLKQEQHP